MIEYIKWPQNPNEPLSPFLVVEGQRPIRITFHTSTFANLSAEEQEAFKALQDLSHLPEIDALQTEMGDFAQLQIGAFDGKAHNIPVSVKCDRYEKKASISNAHQLRNVAANLVAQTDLDHPAVTNMLNDLIVARAHYEIGQDIFVTQSKRLIRHRTLPPVQDANPRTLVEAAQLIGLLLRSHDDYSWSTNKKLNRGWYYSILVHNRIPNLWRYRGVCAKAGEVRNDDTSYLGQSVLDRCVRVLQARDAIGEQFYIPQNNETQSVIMSHFDHLTLELNGVFDALARVTHRAYKLDLSSSITTRLSLLRDFRLFRF
jgi:hypothetical protein